MISVLQYSFEETVAFKSKFTGTHKMFSFITQVPEVIKLRFINFNLYMWEDISQDDYKIITGNTFTYIPVYPSLVNDAVIKL